MRSSLLKNTIRQLYETARTRNMIPRTVAIEGPPGGGKTTICHEVAVEIGIPYVELHMPTMMVEDFGIPFPKAGSDNTEFDYMMPAWFPYQGKPGTENGGILLFDDRNQANADLQKVLANICQARTLHGHKLAEGWMVISTGNRQEDRAGANKVLSHLRNRETVLQFETHLDDWTDWASANGVRPEVISFIRFRPGLLHKFDAQQDVNPTPRSWVEGVSNVIGEVPLEAEYECFTGAVGGAASEFVGFLRVFRDLPDPDKVLADPLKAEVPSDPAVCYALAGAIAHRLTKKNIGNGVEFLNRMKAEFSVLTMKMAVQRDKTLHESPAFVKWGMKHQKVLI